MLLTFLLTAQAASPPPDARDDEESVDEEPDDADADEGRPRRGFTRARRAAYGTGRAVTIAGGGLYVAGWAMIAGGAQNYDVQRFGYVVTRVGLPVATLGTLASAGALDAMGYDTNRTAATAALPLWSAATVIPSTVDPYSSSNVDEILWLGLEASAFALTVTQLVVNEVNLAHGSGRGPRRTAWLDAGFGPDGGYVALSGAL